MSTALPLISLIIPCYNYGAYLPEALDSLLAQTYTNWEAYIIDDGSKDATAEIAQRYAARDGRIHYHYQTNAGLSAARNTGLGLVKGEFIELLDADDYIAPRKLELHLQTLMEHPEAALVFGDIQNFLHTENPADRRLTLLRLQQQPQTSEGQALAMHLAYDNMFLPGNPLFRRELAQQIGNFDETLFSLEDWHYWYRGVLLNARYVYDNRPGTEFYARAHGNNMSGNRYKMWKYKIAARRSLIELMQQQLLAGTARLPELPSVLAKHRALLHEEQARFQLLYASIGQGVLNTLQYFVRGEKPVRIWYDSAYWLKERLLGRNTIG